MPSLLLTEKFLVKRFIYAVLTLVLITGSLFLPGTIAYAQNVNFDFRAINLINDVEKIDAHFGDRPATIKDLAYQYSSRVLTQLPALGGSFDLRIASMGQGAENALVQQNVTATSNSEYAAIAYGSQANTRMVVLQRSKAQFPTQGKALVRIVHAATINNTFDAYIGSIGGTPTFGELEAGKSSNFTNVDDEATTIFITEAGSTTPIAQVTAPLGSGDPYVTLIITGGSTSELKVYALKDFTKDEGLLVLLDEASFTNVRAVHAWPNQAVSADTSLDVYLGDVIRSQGLKYRYASANFGPLVADSLNMKFVPANEAPSTIVLNVGKNFGNDTSYSVILTQFKSGSPTAMVLNRSPIDGSDQTSASTSMIRFANATDFYGNVTIVIEQNGGDSLHFEDVTFANSTPWREITPTNNPATLTAYRTGETEPFYSGMATLPKDAHLTIIALGDDMQFSVDMLNETLPGSRRMQSFDIPSAAPNTPELYAAMRISNSPNPFSEATTLSFEMERPGVVTVELYDMLGRNIALLMEEHQERGEHSLRLSAASLPAGTYTCVIRTEYGAQSTHQMVVVR